MPSRAFEALIDRPYPFFLDSGVANGDHQSFSFLGCDPFLVLRSTGNEITLSQAGTVQRLKGDPIAVLGRLIESYHVPRHEYPAPLIGGAVGYLGYDLGRFVEKLPCTTVDDVATPEMFVCFYDTIAAYDHTAKATYVVSTGWPEKTESARWRRARDRAREMEAMLGRSRGVRPCKVGRTPGDLAINSNFSHEGYLEAVEKARAYIEAGDIYQVNLSQRLEARCEFAPYELYRRLRRISPAPYACYQDFGELAVVSASPERFLRVTGDLVETRPIKGTRPRGRTPSEDRVLADELEASVKDMAEHIMIVDLERNDLGRVCRHGTVSVDQLMALERYATVFHLTSTIRGKMAPEKTATDLLRACFPGGSITGAPKIRAMEIIDELEPTRRGVYTGSIGYFSFTGDIDLNIAIRTMVVKGDRAYFQVGGAVVFDSTAEGEYQETLDKARAMSMALGIDGLKVES